MTFHYEHSSHKLFLVDATRTEYFQLQIFLTRHVKGYMFQKPYKMGVWDGTRTHFKKDGFSFGLWNEIRKCCQSHNFKFEIDNSEEFPLNKDISIDLVQEFTESFFENHKLPSDTNKQFIPYDYQQESVFNLLKYRYSCIEVATAGGKSLIYGLFLFYYLRNINPNAKFLLIVPSITLVKQFYNDLMDYNYGFNKENRYPIDLRVTEIMSSKPRVHDNPNLIIGTYQSLEKMKPEWFKPFEVVTVDEHHKSSAVTLQKVLTSTLTTAKYRFGMSGTYPTEETVEYLDVISVTGPIVNRVEAYELIDRGIIAPVKIKAVMLNHDDSEFRENLYFIRQSGKGSEAFNLEKDYIHNSNKRVSFIINNILSKVTKNTLVLFFTIEYGEKLYNEARNTLQHKNVYYIDGSVDGEKREEIKRFLEDTSGNPSILFASYGTFAVGVSIRSLCNVVLADSFKSEQIVIQSIGRILRLHKEKDRATVFDIVDIFDAKTLKSSPNILYKHYQERKKFYDKRQYPNDSILVKL